MAVGKPERLSNAAKIRQMRDELSGALAKKIHQCHFDIAEPMRIHSGYPVSREIEQIWRHQDDRIGAELSGKFGATKRSRSALLAISSASRIFNRSKDVFPMK